MKMGEKLKREEININNKKIRNYGGVAVFSYSIKGWTK